MEVEQRRNDVDINTSIDIDDSCDEDKGPNENECNIVTEVDIDASCGEDKEPNENECNIVTEGDELDYSGSLMQVRRAHVEDIYEIYCKHARTIGFSVRKSTSRYDSDDNLMQKNYVCSCQGLKKKPQLEGLKRRKVNDTRTDCNASLRVQFIDGMYEVVRHLTQHNHDLTRKKWSHFHRSERSITSDKAIMIQGMVSSGMKIADSFRYMAAEAGGERSLGHTMKDHFNFVSKLKMKVIEGGDAQALIDALTQRGVEDKDFFFRVKLDGDGRLSNVFWRDSMMKEDYMMYGDVVVFDTTYRTNKYNLICGPFVGLNNHKKNIMFACAFLSDETIESFEWLFTIFKKSMEGKCPVSMFTDQDLAISNAIERVFPYTRHRLCLWHLHENAVKRFGKLKGDRNFTDLFEKCLSGCSNEVEFDNCWSSMMSTYNLQDHSWFKRLYTLKDKWSTSFNKKYFSAGIKSSQRSESTNSSIGFKSKKTTTLMEFYDIFNDTVHRWRRREAEDDFKCSRQVPQSKYPLTGILKQAAEVYTLTIFWDFENEINKTMSTTFKKLYEEEGTCLYTVIHDGGLVSHEVAFHALSNFISCSCMKFEECGILCHHCLRVFHVNSVVQLPDRYVLKRWTKLCKKELWDKFDALESERSTDGIPWRHEMTRKYYSLVQKAQENDEARKIIADGFERDVRAIEELMNKLAIVQEEKEIPSSSITVMDPARSKTKGRSKRIKGNKERKNKKKTTNRSKMNQPVEFGSKTPNPRLF